MLVLLEAARQVGVTCLGQARCSVRLVRESKAFQHARTLSRDDPERQAGFSEARARHSYSEYVLHAYAQQFGHSWLGEQRYTPRDPGTGLSGLPRRQSTAPGEGSPGLV
jgi:hypothetical protein